jgi:glutathione synthase/RimK-type ligase-like ATP-grasp enzyme
MLVGIHKAEYGKNGFERFQKYREILKYNGIEYIDLFIDQPDFWEIVKKCDLFIYRYSHIDVQRQIADDILPILEEHYKVKCFPNQATCWHFDDKIRQHLLMKSYGFPMIESYVFYDKSEALNWSNNISYPVVFKLRRGAGSENVLLINNQFQSRKMIIKMFGTGIKNGAIQSSGSLRYYNLGLFFKKSLGKIYYRTVKGETSNWTKEKNYVYFQKFLPGNTFDIRITVIGRWAFGFRRFTRKNDFRASGSGKIDFDNSSIPLECIRTAFNITERMDFQTMSYDFLKNQDGQYQFCEMNYTYDDRTLYNCPGYWDQDLIWHDGHFWPQYCQLRELLGKTDLQQPNILNE